MRGCGGGVGVGGEEGLPVADVVPAVELPADAAEGADVGEAAGFVEGDGGVVGEGDPAEGAGVALARHGVEEGAVERTADAAAMVVGVDVDGGLGGELVGAAAFPGGGFGKAKDGCG
jgi:hypothetical protein